MGGSVRGRGKCGIVCLRNVLDEPVEAVERLTEDVQEAWVREVWVQAVWVQDSVGAVPLWYLQVREAYRRKLESAQRDVAELSRAVAIMQDDPKTGLRVTPGESTYMWLLLCVK